MLNHRCPFLAQRATFAPILTAIHSTLYIWAVADGRLPPMIREKGRMTGNGHRTPVNVFQVQ